MLLFQGKHLHALLVLHALTEVNVTEFFNSTINAGYDYNTALAGGTIGGAGIKARINQRGFQYASTLIAPILDQQIRTARIPPISQCIPEVVA